MPSNCALEKSDSAHPNHDRYLLCVGVCNTLLDVPSVYASQDEVLLLWQSENPDPVATIRHAWDVLPTLPNAVPLDPTGHPVALKRPHLQELVDYIRQQPNLDVAIVTGSTREYVDRVLGKVSPELLALCTFVWTREDGKKFLSRAGYGYRKSLHHIPELMGYRLGRILMMEHGLVDPPELKLNISPYIFFSEFPEACEKDKGIPEIIRRLKILLTVDDILALRRQESQQRLLADEQRHAWIKEQRISLFDTDYEERMQACPVTYPLAIDD